MVQETHLKQDRSPYLVSQQFPYVYRADAKTSKAGGVAILIGRSVNWKWIDTTTDAEGRWVLVNGKCFGKDISLASIYAPNSGQVGFLEKMLEDVMEAAKGPVIVGGDFNLTLNPKMDTSKGRSTIAISGLRRLRKALREYQLMDVWRINNPIEKDYTYYSPVHGSYSRLDHIMMKHADLKMVKKIDIKNFTISDHAPVVMDIIWKD